MSVCWAHPCNLNAVGSEYMHPLGPLKSQDFVGVTLPNSCVLGLGCFFSAFDFSMT